MAVTVNVEELLPADAVPSREMRMAVGIGRDRWNELLRSGAIPFLQLGLQRYVRKSDVAAYFERAFEERGRAVG
ncbi:hypothetical protein R3Q15_09390 [Gordonia amicalis]|uniref:Uncharacterized protein n=1 Tax=Gordonia amicalis TaxID=89053 RepID=A0AAE4R2D5_9ACTN|nr:hypothetical protein [Gordonia amicalis]MDV6312095.1 hypothetical protein [Gordonia amicalis]